MKVNYLIDYRPFSICKNLLQGISNNHKAIMFIKAEVCRVLHTARCTNVIRLGHLALHSKVVSGLQRQSKMNETFKIKVYEEAGKRGEE
jgi:hypothetical protein